jgi:hypothetical protein
MRKFTEEEIKMILSFDPFAGDEGTLKKLEDKIVVSRKHNRCSNCFRNGKAGDPERVIKDIFDGEFQSHRYCALCCCAMLRDVKADDFGDRLYLRHEQAIKKRGKSIAK